MPARSGQKVRFPRLGEIRRRDITSDLEDAVDDVVAEHLGVLVDRVEIRSVVQADRSDVAVFLDGDVAVNPDHVREL